MKTFDVAILGAGLGGATAANALSRRGARVAIIERATFPRHKVCGEFLSPEINAVFARVGVAENIAAAQPKIVTQARIVAGASTRESLCLPVVGGALALSRFRLDQILLDKARENGAHVFASTRALSVEENYKNCDSNQARFIVKLRGGEESEIAARFVLDASGRGAQFDGEEANETARRHTFARHDSSQVGGEKPHEKLPRHIGLKAHFRNANLQKGVVELHPFRGGYCGLVRIEDDLCNVCLLSRYDVLQGRAPRDFWNFLLQENAALAARMRGATQLFDWLATANVIFGKSQPGKNGVLRCGDTAGFIHPLTGDGMAMAARAGELAAATIGAALRGHLTNAQVEEIYAAAWHREFDARLRVGARLQPLLTDPRACAPAVFALKAAPRFARKLVEFTRGH